MARKRVVKKIDGKEYELKELTVINIIDLIQNFNFFQEEKPEENKKEENIIDTENIVSIISFLEKVLKVSADFDINDLKTLSPSEIRILFEAFKEVNSDFFLLLQKTNLLEVIQNIQEAMMENFSRRLVLLLSQDI